MYRIGEFSKMTELSVRTLRYYDAINLLKPKYVDEFTSYRYYTDENVSEANLIKLLKDLDFTLEEIVLYKDNLNEIIIENKIQEEKVKQEELEQKIRRLEIIKEEITKTNVKTQEKVKILENTNVE